MKDKLEKLLKGALLAIEGAAIISDSAGEVRFLSKSAYKLLGLDEGISLPLPDSIKINFYEFTNGDKVEKKAFPLSSVLAKSDFSNLLLQIENPEGEKRILSFSSKKIRDENNEVIGALLKINDLSLRLHHADSSRRKEQQGEGYLSEFASNASDVLLESFIYSVSHDLQAPLRHIQGFSELLNEECSDCISDDGRAYISKMQMACTNIQQQVVNLVQLSRNTRGRMFCSVVNLSDIAREILDGLKRKSYDREVNFLVEPDLEVKGDQRLLIVLLQHLIGNAWKFTGKRDKTCIEFGMKKIEGINTYYIYDNGVGFDMQRADKLFLPFRRLHDDSFPGKGLGLATALCIINRHGGKIWFESEPDMGTTFFFTLA